MHNASGYWMATISYHSFSVASITLVYAAIITAPGVDAAFSIVRMGDSFLTHSFLSFAFLCPCFLISSLLDYAASVLSLLLSGVCCSDLAAANATDVHSQSKF